MASYFFLLQMFFSMVLSGYRGGDMLDCMSTESYWKAKNISITAEQLKEFASEPPPVGDISELVKDLCSPAYNVRETARKKIELMGPGVLPQLNKVENIKNDGAAHIIHELQHTLGGPARAQQVQRLMAIRTLGEKKVKAAVGVLEEDLKSKEAFVADYAARSLALIQDKPLPVREIKKNDKDVWLLPADANFVAQFHPWATGQLPGIEELTHTLAGQMDIDRQNPDELTKEAYTAMLGFVEKVGNIRVDGVTVGISSRGDKDSDAWVIILRGLYDRQAVMAFLTKSPETEMEGDIFVHRESNYTAQIFPSDDMAIQINGNTSEARDEAIKQFLAAYKAGKGKLAEGRLKDKIVELQEKGGPVWFLLEPSKDMQRAVNWIAPFSMVAMSSKVNEKSGKATFSILAEGKDSKAVKASINDIELYLKQGIDNLAGMDANARAPKAALELLKSIKVEPDGNNAVMNGDLTENMGQIFMLILFGSAF